MTATLFCNNKKISKPLLKKINFKQSCHVQFPYEFAASQCVFEVLTLVGQNKLNTSKAQHKAENACANGMCKRTLRSA